MSPTGFSELSLEFLQSCLTANGHDGSLLKDFRLAELPEPGQTAAMAFVELDYGGAPGAGPSRLVAKQKTDFADAQAYIEKLGATEREVAFYDQIGDACQMPIPKGYYGAYKHGDFLLLMEDKSGPKPGDWITATTEQARGMLGNLQSMHAHWWENEDLKKADWSAGFNSESGCFMQTMQATFQMSAKGFLESFKDELEDNMAETILAAYNKPEVISAFDSMTGTLIHGDYHFKNAFFPEDAAPIVFDWQCSGYGTPTIDLARVFIFLRGGDDMDKETDEMLIDYHSALAARGISSYSLTQLQADMAPGFLYNTWLTVNALMETDVELIRSIVESHGSTLSELMTDFNARIKHSGCREFIENY